MPDSHHSRLDFATLQRASIPNDALACSPDVCLQAEPSRHAIVLPANSTTVGEALRRVEPSAEIWTEPSGEVRAHYVAVTPLLRFKDDVDILIRPSGAQQSIVAIYSRSRVGYSDLGTNARRIDSLERRLRTELAANSAG
ncbi:MAG: hypothetical protein DCF16_12630 [Alphaproteobacteria bacterium]|nr:MAG: hypothetical protein DCF16_12630 [Alphaproteobacteria bacterium]